MIKGLVLAIVMCLLLSCVAKKHVCKLDAALIVGVIEKEKKGMSE